MTIARRIAIVGGGWSGLSCAAWLKREQPGLSITIFEASPQLGGRARGLSWTVPTSDQAIPIDNGQHLTIGAYRETFALLSMVGAPQWESTPLVWTGVSRGARITQTWQVPDTAWPWRALAGLLPGRGPTGWPPTWKRSIARTLVRLIRHRWQAAPQSALAWLNRQNVPDDFIAHFWRPLCEGALNTALEEASAQILIRVVRDSLAGPSGSTRVMTPPTNLSQEGVDPIVHWLDRHGVTIRPRCRIDRHHALAAFDRVVLALPTPATIRYWDNSGLPATFAKERWDRLESRPITTVWIALSPDQLQAMHHLPDWFVLNALPQVPHIGQVVVKRRDAIGVVISAHGIADRIDAAQLLAQQLSTQLGIAIEQCPQKWITEKQATWAATCDAPMASSDEANGDTGVPHLYRCADDLEPGYPATIESAVRSGKRVAMRIANDCSD